jgi:hypothetical protein
VTGLKRYAESGVARVADVVFVYRCTWCEGQATSGLRTPQRVSGWPLPCQDSRCLLGARWWITGVVASLRYSRRVYPRWWVGVWEGALALLLGAPGPLESRSSESNPPNCGSQLSKGRLGRRWAQRGVRETRLPTHVRERRQEGCVKRRVGDKERVQWCSARVGRWCRKARPNR